MSIKTNSIKKYAIPIFLILTPLLSNAIVLLLPLPVEAGVLLAAFVPIILAIVLVGMENGRKELGTLLRKPFQWRISLKWYVVALVLPLIVHLSANLLAVLFGWIPAIQFNFLTAEQLIVGIVILILAVIEEVGWRGFVLPRLLSNRSALFSAVLIGIAWGSVHIGIGIASDRPLLPTFLAPFATSVFLTWLFVQTKGNLWMIVLAHFALNFFSMFFSGPSLEQAIWLQAIVEIAVAVVLILSFGPNLQRSIASQTAVLQPKLEQ